MARIKITLYFKARKILGQKSITIQATTVKEALHNLLDNLSHETRESLIHEVFRDNTLQVKNYNILVNGRNIKLLENMDTKLNENDEIVIVPAIGGGTKKEYYSKREEKPLHLL